MDKADHPPRVPVDRRSNPPFMRDWDKLLKAYGAATVIALFLVYWLTGDVMGTLKTLAATTNEHATETAIYLRQICLNTATTENQRAGCPPLRERLRRD